MSYLLKNIMPGYNLLQKLKPVPEVKRTKLVVKAVYCNNSECKSKATLSRFGKLVSEIDVSACPVCNDRNVIKQYKRIIL